MRPSEDFIVAGILPKQRGDRVHSMLDTVLQANLDESYFTGNHQHLFRAAVSANVLNVALDEEVLQALLHERQVASQDVLACQIMLRDLSGLDVTYEKLRVLIPSYRDSVHASRMANALEESVTVLTEGAKIEGEWQEGYRAARTVIMSRLAELDKREVGVLPTKEIRETADELLLEYEKAKQKTEVGVLTGINEIDALTNGVQNGELWILCAYTGEGKALSLDTPIPTPSGWTTMGEIKVGDTVFDEDGKPTRVTFVSGVQHDRRCYRVVFNDGETIVADAEHQWAVRRWMWKNDRPLEITTTEKMAANVLQSGRPRYAIPANEALELPDIELPVDPYVLGAWLGDGNSADGIMTVAEQGIVDEFAKAGVPLHPLASAPYRYGTNGLQTKLRALGVLRNKHVPASYLRAGTSQRLALLQGLMDTDGHVSPRGQCEFVSMSETLARGVEELARSLGIKTGWTTGEAKINGKSCGTKYRVRWTSTVPVFRLKRKKDRLAAVRPDIRTRRRYIIAIEPVDSVPVQCIQVDSPNHLFLAGRSMVPTHNTQVLLNIAYNATVYQGKNVAFVSMEMPLSQVRRRMISRHTNHARFGLPGGLDYVKIKDGTLDYAEEQLYFQVVEDWKTNPAYGKQVVLQVSKSENVQTLQEKLMYVRSHTPIDLLVLDYASLLSSVRRRGDRRDEIVEVIEGLKAMALTFNEGEGLRIVTANQISRKAREEAEQLKRYGLSYASETSAIEKNADLLGWLLRTDELKANKEVLMGISKYRDGDIGREFTMMERYESSLLTNLGPSRLI